MTAQELLRACRERGVHLGVQGGVHTGVHTSRLHVRAPRGSLTPELRKALQEQRDEVLAALQPGTGKVHITPSVDAAHVHTVSNGSSPLTEVEVREERQDWIAVRLYSRLLECELWLARDKRTRDALIAEETDLPVLLVEEIPQLSGKPAELLRAVLRSKRVFLGARWVQ